MTCCRCLFWKARAFEHGICWRHEVRVARYETCTEWTRKTICLSVSASMTRVLVADLSSVAPTADGFREIKNDGFVVDSRSALQETLGKENAPRLLKP